MRALRRSLLVLVAGLVSVARPSVASAQQPSLYTRLGGYDALAAVTDDFLARMFADPRLSHFFTGLGADSRKRTRQLIVDELCAVTGGPCVYLGREMRVAHGGLGITRADWDASVALLTASLEKFRVPPNVQREFLALATQLRDDIIDGQ